MGGSTFDDFAWLRAYQPVARVGTSIWLYSIPDSVSASPASVVSGGPASR
jgi:hypothetical protein